MEIDFNNLEKNHIEASGIFEKKVNSFITEWFSPVQEVTVQTSGSTGKPKIFPVEKDRMIASAEMTCNFLTLKAGDKALLCLPVEYISGKMMVVRAIARKLKLTVGNPTSKPLAQEKRSYDFCAMSPLQVENSLDSICLIKNLIIGGAAVSENLKGKIHQSLSGTQNRVFETYGMSETLSHIALKQIYPVAEDFFTVLEGVEINKDERGCLEIFAPKLNPELLQTNDLVELRNEKEFKFLGRIDHVINSGGLKIFPEQLETLMKRKVSNELVFAGLKDEKFGQKLVLMIEGEESAELNSSITELLPEIEAGFSKNHKPKEIFYIKNFPRFENGKLNRKALLNFL